MLAASKGRAPVPLKQPLLLKTKGPISCKPLGHFSHELSPTLSRGRAVYCRAGRGTESRSRTSPQLVNRRSQGWVEARLLVGVSGILGIHVNPNHSLYNWKV